MIDMYFMADYLDTNDIYNIIRINFNLKNLFLAYYILTLLNKNSMKIKNKFIISIFDFIALLAVFFLAIKIKYLIILVKNSIPMSSINN